MFQTKDQVINSLSETFSKRVKEVQNMYMKENILKMKISEMASQKQFDNTLNNNVKIVKQIELFGGKKVLLIQVISNNECYLIDEFKLSEVAVSYLKQFIPRPVDAGS